MRVVVLGGYGAFGSLLAQLLIRDGHKVWIAGRSLTKARSLAERIGANPLQVDLKAEPAAVFGVRPEVVVDAAGPFQGYGNDPYFFANLCLDNEADYFDLSDDPEFSAGIAKLNSKAVALGRRAISGASSVPGVSSAVVRDLADGFEDIQSVETAILPGNRAPRGYSVISSIVGQVGHPARVWRGGVWRECDGWTEKRRYRVSPGDVRSAYFVAVPDIRLFPEFFNARSVMFRAGMELKIMNFPLTLLAWARTFYPFREKPAHIRLLQWLSEKLLWFGTDRGAMIIKVVGTKDGKAHLRQWKLLAEHGEGPFIPGIAVRTLLRRLDQIPAGARPCLAEFSLREAENAMSDLAISTKTTQELRPTLFQKALADRWSQLPPTVRRLHSVQDIESFSGTARVERGSSFIARLAAWFFGFPEAGENVPITITKTRTEKGETWERNFDGRVFRSYCTQSSKPYRYKERFWLFNYEQDLPVKEQTLFLPVRRGWFLGLPIPNPLLPTSDSKEYEVNGVFHFDVALGAPFGRGLIVRYRGWLVPDAQDPFSQ